MGTDSRNINNQATSLQTTLSRKIEKIKSLQTKVAELEAENSALKIESSALVTQNDMLVAREKLATSLVLFSWAIILALLVCVKLH